MVDIREAGKDADVSQENDLQTETWHEELPPEDDFHDHPEHGVASSVTEEVVSVNPFEGANPGKRSGTSLMVGIIAVVILFIGGMIYLQFGSEDKSQTSTPVPFSVSKATEPTPTKKAPSIIAQGGSDQHVSSTTAEADIKAIYNAGLAKTTAPTVSSYAIPGSAEIDEKAVKPVETQTNTSDIIETSPVVPSKTSDATVSQVATSAAAKSGALPNSQQSLKIANGGSETKVVTQQPATTVSTVTTQEQGGIDARLKEITGQIEEIKNSLQQNIQQTNQLAARLEARRETTPDVASFEDRLSKIEQQISALVGKKKLKSAEKTTVKEQTVGEETASSIVVEKEPAKSKPKITSSSTRSKTKKYQKTRAGEHKTESWVLRAATPDAAWVSKSLSSPQLQQVRVGDALPGIGKIREIRQEDNVWTVIGDKGTIH